MTLRVRAPLLLVLLLCSLSLPSPVAAATPYTLTHDVRVKIDARLQLMGFGHEGPPHRALLAAMERTPLGFTHGFDVAGESFEVDVTLTPAVNLVDERCRVEVDIRVRPPGEHATRVTQTLSMAPERVRLLELWSGSRMEERLVLAFTTTWESIPRVNVLRPGAEPVAIVLEVLEGQRVLQRHEFAAIVGESSVFAVRHTPSEHALAPEGGHAISAELDFLPKGIEGGEVDLSVTLLVSGGAASEGEPFRVDMREKLSPGFSLLLPFPAEAGGGESTRIRVTPWF